jgi:hypothetical protein
VAAPPGSLSLLRLLVVAAMTSTKPLKAPITFKNPDAVAMPHRDFSVNFPSFGG